MSSGPETKPEQLKLLSVEPLWRRVLLAVPVVLVLAGVWTGARWFVGNTMASYPADVEMAGSATRLAPDDPQAHFTLAVLRRKTFLPEDLEQSLRGYERATSLSPNDYRLWVELGNARRQAGDLPGSERALRHAVELAPAYAYPRWHLGNVLLRQERTDEAFAELRRASEADPGLRPPVMGLAWRVFGNDFKAVAEAFGNTPAVRGEIVDSLANLKRLDEALRVWSSFSAQEKKELRPAGERLLGTLAVNKRFIAALATHREITGESELAVGKLANGSFENNIGRAGTSLFGWQMPPGGQTQVAIDTRTHRDGARGVRIVFNEPTSPQFKGIAQIVVVEPQAKYRLTFWVRAEDLKSVSTPLVDVVDSTDPSRVLAASTPLPNGSIEWQEVTLEFSVPVNSEAVTVRITRQDCGQSTCPIFGKVWYDHFDFQPSRGNSSGADSGTRRDNASTRGPA